MEKNHLSIKSIRQKKFFMILPVFVVPFATFFLWAIGLVGSNKVASNPLVNHGLNVNLPGVLSNKDSSWDKLRYYEKADRDSSNFQSLLKNDPYYKARANVDDSSLQEISKYKFSYDPAPNNVNDLRDVNEEKVYKKLAELNMELDKQQPVKESDMQDNSIVIAPSHKSIEKMQSQKEVIDRPSDTAGDPELHQLDNMLNKILDIQHPERSVVDVQKESLKSPRKVFTISKTETGATITILKSKVGPIVDSGKQSAELPETNPFHTVTIDQFGAGPIQNSILVSFPESQTISQGAIVKMQLLNKIYINGLLINRGEFIYGTATISNERLLININSIRMGNNILPVSLTAYDLDGQLGMYIPNAVGRDVAKQSGSDAMQGLNFSGLDPSIGTQAANAGIQAAKTLFSKKIKQVNITVMAGYEVLLLDNEQNK